eukprot:268110_1
MSSFRDANSTNQRVQMENRGDDWDKIISHFAGNPACKQQKAVAGALAEEQEYAENIPTREQHALRNASTLTYVSSEASKSFGKNVNKRPSEHVFQSSDRRIHVENVKNGTSKMWLTTNPAVVNMAPDEQLSMYCSKLSIPERLGPVKPKDGPVIFQATQNFVGKTVYLIYLSKSGLSVKPAFVQPEYAENLPTKERHDVEGAFNNNADHDEPGQHDNYSNEKLPSYEEALTHG